MLTRGKALGTGIVDNVAVEGLSSVHVVEPVRLSLTHGLGFSLGCLREACAECRICATYGAIGASVPVMTRSRL